MIWRKVTLRLADSLPPLTCTILPVHPWTPGVGRTAATGSYLSPQNAVHWLAQTLSGTGRNLRVMVVMLCATSQPEFMSQLTAFSAVLPLPVLGQVSRMAQTAATQAITRMQLPPKAGVGLPAPLPLSAGTLRLAQRAKIMAEAKAEAASGASVAQLQAHLTALSDARQSAHDAISQALGELSQKSVNAWVFTGEGLAVTLAVNMQKKVPQPDAVMTLATLFAGDEVLALEAMVHDNHHIGP